jgi:hypothetical protein
MKLMGPAEGNTESVDRRTAAHGRPPISHMAPFDGLPAPADGVQLVASDAAGRFRCAQYGAVYQLGARLNELMLQVRI